MEIIEGSSQIHQFLLGKSFARSQKKQRTQKKGSQRIVNKENIHNGKEYWEKLSRDSVQILFELTPMQEGLLFVLFTRFCQHALSYPTVPGACWPC